VVIVCVVRAVSDGAADFAVAVGPGAVVAATTGIIVGIALPAVGVTHGQWRIDRRLVVLRSPVSTGACGGGSSPP
jgi:hypothetical protein